MKSMGDLIGRWLPGRLVPLGTDGFGMSDTRVALRRHFEVDAEHIAVAALHALHHDGSLPWKAVACAMTAYGISA
jgi:pyruvate dehydrogenase E1 component